LRESSASRGIEVVHEDEPLATSFFEGDRGDDPTFIPFVIRPESVTRDNSKLEQFRIETEQVIPFAENSK
jgi:hypothetical protein